MNEGHEDRILDSFLEEMLTNQHPPDLTEQIQQRLRAELGAERFQQLRTGGIRSASKAEERAVTARSTAWSTSSVWSTTSAAVLTLAAGLMLTIAVWKFWPASQAIAPQAQSTPKTPAVPPSKDLVQQTLVAPQPELPKGKELSLDQLPFAKDNTAPELPHRLPAAAPVAAMEDDEIIRWMDERFAKLWESEGLKSHVRLDENQWMDQIAERLASAGSASAQSPRELAEKLVRTAGFAENFADRMVSYWLRGTAEANSKNPAGAKLRAYVAGQLVARKPWNEVLSSLINSQPNEPQAVLLTSLAGDENHRLAGRIGSVMLDEALACARCHDASENGRLVSMDQDDYWSLVAMFSGISVKQTKANGSAPAVRELVDNQKQLFAGAKHHPVYFERPDGRLQLVRYRLPGGDDWRAIEDVQTPRESLARWVNRSSITDEASVNLAWRLVYGRPLVAQHAALDGEGYSQRREILAMLAEQFQAHNRDMGQLVTWLVSTRPFAQETLNIDRARWLAASEDEILQWSNAAANFAARLPKESSPAIKSLESAVASIDKWSNHRDERRTTLAQPTTIIDTKLKATKEIKPGSEPMIGYLIRSIKPSYAQGLFINRLVKSKLTWEQQVDHIAGLIGEPAGNAQLHSHAKKLLDAQNGNPTEALFQLLQGALMCHEAM